MRYDQKSSFTLHHQSSLKNPSIFLPLLFLHSSLSVRSSLSVFYFLSESFPFKLSVNFFLRFVSLIICELEFSHGFRFWILEFRDRESGANSFTGLSCDRRFLAYYLEIPVTSFGRDLACFSYL